MTRKGHFNRTYRIRVAGKSPKSRHRAYAINVPYPVAEAVPEDAEFEFELTEEGLFYRFVGSKPVADPPSWMRPIESGNP